MRDFVTPIHIEAVGLGNIRFFAPPSGGREFPWVSIEDLHVALTLPRDLRRAFKNELRNSKWRGDVRTVATADDIVDVVPHYMAQGLIDAMHHVGRVDGDLFARYAASGARALAKLTDDLSPPEVLEYLKAAWAVSGGRT